MAFSVFQTVYETVDAVIVSTVIGGYGAVAAMAASSLRAGIAVYMTVACYAVLRGIAGEGFGHVLTQGVKASLVLMAVTSGIGGVSARSVLEWPDLLAAAGGGLAPGAVADQIVNGTWEGLNQIVKALLNAMGSVGVTEITKLAQLALTILIVFMVGIVVMIAALLLGAVVTVMILFMKFGLACAALFGPLFVALILFDSTRGMFFTWLGSALSYALGTVIIGLAVKLMNTAMLELTQSQFAALASLAAGSGSAEEASAAMLGALTALLTIGAIMVIGLIFIVQCQSIAQGLAGGGGGSSGAVAGALIPSTYTVRSGVKALQSSTSKLTGRSTAAASAGLAPGNSQEAQRSMISIMRGQSSAANRAASPVSTS